MVAARPAIARVTAVRRLSGDNDQIAGTQQIFPAVAQTARFPFDNRPYRELRMAVPFIGLATLPGAAQFQPGQLFVAPEGLQDIARMAHERLLSEGDRGFIARPSGSVCGRDARVTGGDISPESSVYT